MIDRGWSGQLAPAGRGSLASRNGHRLSGCREYWLSNLNRLATHVFGLVTPLPIVNGSGSQCTVSAWVAPGPRTSAEDGQR